MVVGKKLAGGLMLIALSVAMTGTATAAVVGDTIVGHLAFGPNGTYGGDYWSPSSIVDPGTFNYADSANIDAASFTGSVLTITDDVLTTANGFEMKFTDATTPFTGLTLVSSNFSPSLTYSISGGTLVIDWVGTFSTAGPLTAVFDTMGGAVPEPATWAMMLLGLGAAGVAMRRRQQVTVSYA